MAGKENIVTDTIWAPKLAETRRPKYLALTDAIRAAVEDGSLTAESRLPTVRALAHRLGITPGTVSRAYGLLTDEGVLRAEVGRGTFVAPANRRIAEPPYILIESSAGQVNLSTSLVPDVGQAAAIRACQEELLEGGSDLLTYPTRGDDLATIQAFLRWLGDIDVGPAWAEDVVLCGGAQHGVTMALQTLSRGARSVVFTEELAYPGFRNAAGLVGADVVGVPMDGDGLIPDALEVLCRRHGPAILCTSAEGLNPTTIRTPPERRARIVEIARAHDMHIVDDDSFSVGRQSFPGYRALAPERGWHVASMSKSVSPALRFGGLIAPKGYGPRATSTAQQQFFGLPRPAVDLCRRLMESGRAHAIRDGVRRVTAERVRIAREALDGHDVLSRDTVPFVWVKMPRGWRASTFARAAERRGILVKPADLFALVDGRAPNAVRLSLNGPMGEPTFRTALETLAGLLKEPPGEVEV